MLYTQVNFDGLSGPTHFYGGLSFGNVASMEHKSKRSNPQAAALQGLKKMRFLMELGQAQALFPPHMRPSIPYLRSFGYCGSDAEVLESADLKLLALCSSSSSMWTANAATVTPSQDSEDGKLHLTPANLISQAHRSIEAEQTRKILERVFPFAVVHAPLPPCFGDEGAANHIRLAPTLSDVGTHLLVYGRSLFIPDEGHFPARQFKEASEAIVRFHKIRRSVLLKQKRSAIDAGVFHNDVIAMGHENLLIYHEEAYEEEPGLPFEMIRVTKRQLPLKEAVRSYLFNSQIVRTEKGLTLIAPQECESLDLSYLPFDQIYYVDLHQSMSNGGGPACLRLRVWLNEEERRKTHQGVFLTPELYDKLVAWVKRHYRDTLALDDLRDPQLLQENYTALDELTELLELGALYPFQIKSI